ncbi:restriction endonuclease subunit S [Flavobacterium sp. UBA7663]|uniref:restriction endonuclease subunit S n=1 Tax=Flavobacterium sp. UBA7663 TaxID=1946557 RepID=UPI0025B9A012|nr:restriction endonuclease subunit S [Flavobacterium sp. UBA7663]
MNNWKQISIGEFVDFNPSESIPKGKLVKKIPMAKLTEFVRKINGYEYAEYNSGPKFRNFDTLVAKITPCLENGKTAFVDILEENEIAFGSSEFIVLRENKNSTSEFVYYLAKSPVFRERAINCMEGTSGRKRVNEGALKRQEIIVPDKPTQQKIAKVLSDLDAKIELNNKINSALEAMAKTLYDYWFVQFDFPDSNGKPYKSSGGKMVWNAELKSEIPKGWEVKSLSYICEIINGYAFKSEWYTDSGVKIIRTKNFENGYVDLNDLVFLDNEFAKQFDKYQLKTYDFLMVMVGASTGKHCTVNSNILPALQNQNMWRFISKIENQQLFLNLKLERIVLELENTTNGSARGFFQKDSFLSKIVEVPNQDLIENFCNKINSVFKRIDNNLKENQELASLRDWLLPMLMNGQVTVASTSSATEKGYEVEDSELGMVAEDKVECKKN